MIVIPLLDKCNNEVVDRKNPSLITTCGIYLDNLRG